MTRPKSNFEKVLKQAEIAEDYMNDAKATQDDLGGTIPANTELPTISVFITENDRIKVEQNCGSLELDQEQGAALAKLLTDIFL